VVHLRSPLFPLLSSVNSETFSPLRNPSTLDVSVPTVRVISLTPPFLWMFIPPSISPKPTFHDARSANCFQTLRRASSSAFPSLLASHLRSRFFKNFQPHLVPLAGALRASIFPPTKSPSFLFPLLERFSRKDSRPAFQLRQIQAPGGTFPISCSQTNSASVLTLENLSRALGFSVGTARLISRIREVDLFSGMFLSIKRRALMPRPGLFFALHLFWISEACLEFFLADAYTRGKLSPSAILGNPGVSPLSFGGFRPR